MRFSISLIHFLLIFIIIGMGCQSADRDHPDSSEVMPDSNQVTPMLSHPETTDDTILGEQGETDTLSRDSTALQISESSLSDEKRSPQAVPVTPKRPSITFENTVYDFEEIQTGDVIDVKFEFTNSGNAPLVVKSATATCGCTIPSYPFIPIEPGEGGFIGVTFNSVGKKGEQKPSVTITTNANPAQYVLHLKGNVLEKGSE